MPTQTKGAKAGAAKTKAKAKSTTTTGSRSTQTRSAVQTAVDLPVGAILEVSDRLADIVEPLTDRSVAERQLKSYRSSLRRTAKRAERRGASARRKAATEARKTRNRVEREARKRQRTVQTTLKRNSGEVEQRVRKAIEEQTSRAQDIVGQVGEQTARAQGFVGQVGETISALR